MSNNIVEEENPNQPQAAGAGGAQDKIRKQARQLAYDVRYKVKGQFKDGQKSDPVSLKRAYMSQLGKSPASGPVRQLAKKMLVGESYDFIDLRETASSVVADAIKKVFDQARSYAWTQMNKPTHPMYSEIQRIIGEKDGHDNITRETRKDILELGIPQQFPE